VRLGCPSVGEGAGAAFAAARDASARTLPRSLRATSERTVASGSTGALEETGLSASAGGSASSAFQALAGAAVPAAVCVAAARPRRRWLAGQLRKVSAKSGDEEEKAPAKKAAGVKTPIPVWVVNLDKSIDRWEKAKAMFTEEGVTADRFPATLGKAMTEEELRENTTFGARYFCTAGMIGCFMSHRRIWERVIKEGIPAAAALEDDVVIYPNFNERLTKLLEELPADWDVCLLGAVGCIAVEQEPMHMKVYGLLTGGGRKSPGKTRSISENVYVPYKPAGTHAYIVSQQGAKKLLERLPKARYHVDLSAWSIKDLNLYAAKQFLATQAFDEEDTTVSKAGAPITKRFLRWCWDCSGLSAMARTGGIPNLTWAWKTAVFALPVPLSKKRIIVEMGPSSSFFVLLCTLSVILRSPRLFGIALAYMSSLLFVIRWLSGTQTVTTFALMTTVCAGIIWKG